MLENLGILGAILFMFLLFALVSIGAMVLYKKKSSQIDQWFTTIQPYLLIGFLLFFLASVTLSTYYYSGDFLPSPASEEGERIVPLFTTTFIITSCAFFLTQVLLFFFAYRYRTTPRRGVRFLKGNIKLELFWIIIPAATFIFLFLWGQVLWAKIHEEPPGEVLELDVMAQQFSWKVRYPGEDHVLGRSGFRFIDQINTMGIDVSAPQSQDDFIPVQMHIPKGKPVRLLLRSKDVIHSFYIPHFRIKMDALPGMTTRVHFTANTTTAEMREKLNDPDFNYEVACAELCGRMHFAMKLILVVDEPEQFEEWYSSQKSWVQKHQEYAIF